MSREIVNLKFADLVGDWSAGPAIDRPDVSAGQSAAAVSFALGSVPITSALLSAYQEAHVAGSDGVHGSAVDDASVAEAPYRLVADNSAGDAGLGSHTAGDREDLRLRLRAEANQIHAEMPLAEIARVEHPVLRAAALWICDFVALRSASSLPEVIESVNLAAAGAYGREVQALYQTALAARSEAKKTAFAKKLLLRVKRLQGLGRELLVAAIVDECGVH